ncbi:YciI family protein [Mesorhizobium australicum]|uniref:Uncharacterized conserved protein n=1 Tax=Mesorhizobium australicum TaxID=536018 RepID=A0A1X7PIU0_9HYPH|nr:YciI family protein [Mesorhizobium australicum]SMH51295.1 Uncharacterized conserved protein [Mesorhizobium australicum]
MQYMLLIHVDETKMPKVPTNETYQMAAAYNAYTEALKKAGVLLAGERLKPSGTAAAVRVRDERTEVLDGPFADTKEQLGGYYLIEAPDMDSAVQWAARCPGSSTGTVEVREVWPAMAPAN